LKNQNNELFYFLFFWLDPKEPKHQGYDVLAKTYYILKRMQSASREAPHATH